jgi:hypothetical protein
VGLAGGPTITAEDVQASEPLYESKLDSSFFRVRLDRTTELERVYLRAMAELGPAPQKAADVAQVVGRDSSQLGPTRAKLISMGLLYTPRHGYAAFTVPTLTASCTGPSPTSSSRISSGATRREARSPWSRRPHHPTERHLRHIVSLIRHTPGGI